MKRSIGFVVAGLAALAVTGAGPVWAQTELPPVVANASIRFGLVGIARGQTARLSVVAVGGVAQFPPSPCVASLRFLDAGGKPFVGPNGVPVAAEFNMVPGEAVSLDLPYQVAFGQSQARRVAFRAGGDITSAVDPELSCPKPVATVELFDMLTGRTQVLFPSQPEIFPKNPVLSPDDPEILRLGMMGLARGQTARISIVTVGGSNQDVVKGTLGFVDAAGKAFTDAKGMPVAAEFQLFPGQTTELDLIGADAFRGSTAMRRDIRPAVNCSVHPELSCSATVEIFDVLTGRTQVLYPSDPDG